jgi:hypothetical protein
VTPHPDQRRAAHPGASSWVAANAGSGKTAVLTDRVARLLLAGSEPARILCLTYTKAAAAEMQTRLFARLGQWAMLDDIPLKQELTDLGEPPEALTPARLARARTLFARALETPGGLKIQTIHAFCDALLRRFPSRPACRPASPCSRTARPAPSAPRPWNHSPNPPPPPSRPSPATSPATTPTPSSPRSPPTAPASPAPSTRPPSPAPSAIAWEKTQQP